jgi:hypothetical protein
MFICVQRGGNSVISCDQKIGGGDWVFLEEGVT